MPIMPDSSSSVLAVAAAGGAVGLSLLLLLGRRRRRSKPQPMSVGRYPLIGSLRHLPEPWHRSLYEMFGDQAVVTVHMGLQKIYVFNQWEPFKEAMIDNAEQLSGRVSQTLAKAIFGDTGSIVGSDGAVWREYRRFTLRALRDLGLGRKAGEDLILAEARHLLEVVDAADGAALETAALLSTATSNIICQLVFGSRLASEDPNFGQVIELFSRITQNQDSTVTNCFFLSLMRLIDRWPVIALLFSGESAGNEFLDNFKRLKQFCDRHRLSHAAEVQQLHKARDFIDAHLMHQRDRPEVFNDTRLSLVVADLFVAGTDTTSNTLRWAILFMIDNPDVAEKTFREIADAVGLERLPEMSDRQRLAYTQAVIEETLRRSSLAPLGIFHRVTETVTVGGFELEKDSICTFNVYSIHHDPRHFPEPAQFRPERHLRDGKFVGCERLAAFGIGRRACIGESLARMELFVFFAALVQRYRFALDPDDSRTVWDLTEDPKLFGGATIRAPPLHKILFIPR